MSKEILKLKPECIKPGLKEKQIALALMKRTGHLKTLPDGSAIFDTRVLNRTLKLLKEKV